MTDILKPRDAKEVEDAVRWALADDKALEVAGQGTKRSLGRPSQTDLTLDLSGLSGVTLYEPEELVLSAKAGTPLAEIETLLDANNQQLAFEPMDYGPLLGGAAGQGTIGGASAANLSGPRRIKAGAARDHFLGVSAVSGRAETFKSGGRVVKNVTGYDMCKLLGGSSGTLAAMTDITVKVPNDYDGAQPRQRPVIPSEPSEQSFTQRRYPANWRVWGLEYLSGAFDFVLQPGPAAGLRAALDLERAAPVWAAPAGGSWIHGQSRYQVGNQDRKSVV